MIPAELTPTVSCSWRQFWMLSVGRVPVRCESGRRVRSVAALVARTAATVQRAHPHADPQPLIQTYNTMDQPSTGRR